MEIYCINVALLSSDFSFQFFPYFDLFIETSIPRAAHCENISLSQRSGILSCLWNNIPVYKMMTEINCHKTQKQNIYKFIFFKNIKYPQYTCTFLINKSLS